MTPQQFIAKWKPVTLSERAACQSHFNDLCELLGQPKPVEADPEGAWYTFERGVNKTAGGHGWADVWMRGTFGWEYKKKQLKKRTLTKLYNERPTWLDLAHKKLDEAVFAAYAWDTGMADEELLEKLLELNLRATIA